MQTSMLLGMFDWIGDFFKALFDIVPKIMYLLYASAACVLDVLQLFFRKLAGLDVYYVDGKPVTGDIVSNFISGILGINNQDGIKFEYSALTTVFWSMIVFGVIICFASTLIAIVKSHYSYDDKAAKGPMQYVYTAGKSIINIVAVPIIIILGLYVSQATLTALDTITSTSSGNIVQMYGQDKVNEFLIPARTSKDVKADENGNLVSVSAKDLTYIYYDIFGFDANIQYGPKISSPIIDHKQSALVGSRSQTFSGSLFKTAAYNANRARLGEIKVDSRVTGCRNSTKGLTLFGNAKTNEELADMIDTAFACNLKLDKFYWANYDDFDIASMKYFTTYLTMGFSRFSKFNVGAVWYYYDLWQFNFIVGFAGVIVCISIFINVVLGLMQRLFMCVGLFLIYPPLFGLTPLDGGKASKGFKENFMKQALMAYGAVVGMNIVFLILPYINTIQFFNIGIADYFAQTLFIIVGLITIKAFISTVSGLIGGEDANKAGDGIAKEVGSVAGKATKMTVGAAVGAIKSPVNAYRGAKAIGNKVSEGVHTFEGWRNRRKADKMDNATTQETLMRNFGRTKDENLTKEKVMTDALNAGLSKRQAKKMWNSVEKVRNGKDFKDKSIKDKGNALISGLESKNKKFARTRAKYGENAAERRTKHDAARKKQEQHSFLKNDAKERYNKNKKGLEGLKSLAFQPFDILDTAGKGSGLYNEFKDNSFWKKPDWAKKTADNTGALLDSLGATDKKSGKGGELIENAKKQQKELADQSEKMDKLQSSLDDIMKKL